MQVVKNDKKTINGWAFFDWANSAYSLVISTAVFPPFYSSITPDQVDVLGLSIANTALYSFAVSFSFIVIAVLSPMLSGIADYSGKRMVFLKFFTIIGSLACASLFFFKDGSDTIFGTAAFIIGTIGFAGGIVFYNAYLPEIVTEDRYDKVSAKGYAFGYFGSVILLIIILAMIQYPALFGLSDSTQAPRIGFVLVGIWWIGFAQITFRRLPRDAQGPLDSKVFKKGFREVRDVFIKIRADKNILKFLIAYFFFIAGVNTTIYLATPFAEKELNFGTAELILIVLILQLVAMIGAYFFAFVSKKVGNKKALLIQLVIWIFICVSAYLTTGKTFFYILAGFVGMVLGGIQSLSRSSYSKMIDENRDELTSYFSFYDVLTKVAVVSGTFVFGIVNQLTHNMRYSVLTIAIFFVVGFILLSSVQMRRYYGIEKA